MKKKLQLTLSFLAAFLLLVLFRYLLASYDSETEDVDVQPPYHHRPLKVATPLKHQQVVLVTGGAGFVGFHVAMALATQWTASVVVLDTFSPYYDVQLKKDRASKLLEAGVKVYRGDLCDRSLLKFLFTKYDFTGVVHLAAQAGVRHSMKEPLQYLSNNVRCFVALLETLKSHQRVALVFASSSTVYGRLSPLPFSPSTTFSAPASVYAASKISNEHFASVFCSRYGLSTVGVRLFTVYGPWGRPDMAVYNFAERIASGRPLVFFESAEAVGRDFTFVSDVVSGVLLALEHPPSRCAEVYNLGFGRTVDLAYLLKLLEKELNKTAKIDYQPLPLSDLPSTLADVSESRSVLGFQARVSVEQGVREFVRWFKEYKALRAKREEVQRNRPLEEMLERGERERLHSQQGELERANVQYRARMKDLRARYEDFARGIGRELPADLGNKQFLHHPGMDSPGSTIIKLMGYQDNMEMLKRQCRKTELCVGFTASGELKSRVKPSKQWVQAMAASDGLYVADIDVCAADLHGCTRHQTCRYTGPSTYNCTCQRGFARLGSGCVAKYREGVVSEQKAALERSDYFDGVDWQGTAADKEFVFFQGLDSTGGDYLVVEGSAAGGVKRLEEVCRETYHCLAFNTNGLLKHSVRQPQQWVRWTADADKGLYVLDVDYCGLSLEQCPTHSSCHRFSPSNYSCTCERPWLMSPADKCELVEEGAGKGHRTLLVEPAERNLDDRMGAPGGRVERNLDGREEGVGAPGGRVERNLDGREAGVEPRLPTRETHSTPLLRDIHVIMCSDAAAFPGIVAMVTSIVNNTRSPHRLKLHVVLTETTETSFRQYLSCFPPLPPLDVVQLDAKLLTGRIHVHVKNAGNLSSVANFARFYLHALFPGVAKALYFDADTIMRGDIAELWEQLEESDQLIMAAPRDSPTLGAFVSSKAQQLFQQRYGKTFNKNEKSFNAGVYGVNLDLWREKHIHEEVLYWMDQQAKERLWEGGSQPILLLVAHGRWSHMDREWNQDGLGWSAQVPEAKLKSAKVLHWTGARKPWKADGLHKELWPTPLACSGRGSCLARGAAGYGCSCQQNHSGGRCQFTQ